MTLIGRRVIPIKATIWGAIYTLRHLTGTVLRYLPPAIIRPMKTGCLIWSLTGGKERLKRYVSIDLQRCMAYGSHEIGHHRNYLCLHLHYGNDNHQ